ncbi:unnamed protein product [Cuscuta epithymum]|uniref:Uncharacterized protein n=1 Tax=Cuscuta epithymum TaxID=186058 RepID=A0AAV0G755_9ASTE|nr:unnamed protein product [Cuscuta epithymum]
MFQLEDYHPSSITCTSSSKWSFVLKLSIDELNWRRGNPHPPDIICFHPDGNVVYMKNGHSIFSLNLQSGEVIYETALLDNKLPVGRYFHWNNVTHFSKHSWPTPMSLNMSGMFVLRLIFTCLVCLVCLSLICLSLVLYGLSKNILRGVPNMDFNRISNSIRT